MNNITLNPGQTLNSNLSMSRLKQSEYSADLYNEMLENIKGALTVSYGEDISSIFLIGCTSLSPNDFQSEALGQFQCWFESVQNLIDPERLKFSITKAADDEICINRKATLGGRVKLIIHDDGMIALSYLPNGQATKILEFFNSDKADYESLTYNFFKY